MKFLKTTFTKARSNQFLTGSLVMFVGMMIANLGSYLYHLLMGRMLGPADYGVLASLISLLYLLGIPILALSLVIVKFVSAYKGQKKFGAIRRLFIMLTQKIFLFGIVWVLIFLLLTPFLTSFLHLKSSLPLVIVAAIAFITLFVSTNRGFLQGILRFGYLSSSIALEVGIKLCLAVFLVYLGFKVKGAIFAALVGVVVAYLFTNFFLKKFLKVNKGKDEVEWRPMIEYGLPVFFSILAFTSLYSTDVVLARHFLSAREAGYYASLAVMGKIVYYASYPIIMVMFPLVSERQANGREYKPLLSTSLGLVGIICLGIVGIYFLLPTLMIKILFGSAYLSAAKYLGLFGIFLSLHSLSFLLTNFCLSINQVKIVILPILAAFLQIILISLFHQNLWQVIWASIVVLAFLFCTQTLFYLYSTTKE